MQSPTDEVVYAINDIYPTIQGEGRLTGTPMTLVRLQGCPVGCPFCDTKFTWAKSKQYRKESIKDIFLDNNLWCEATAAEIIKETTPYGGIQWILLTGGEPGLQKINELVRAFNRAGYKVAVETSGVGTGVADAFPEWICVSPKIGITPDGDFNVETIIRADELKFVIGKQSDISAMEQWLRKFSVYAKNSVRRSVQPVSCNVKATRICMDYVIDEEGFCLSLQSHKMASIR